MRFRDFTEVVCHIKRSNVFYDITDFYTISPGAGILRGILCIITPHDMTISSGSVSKLDLIQIHRLLPGNHSVHSAPGIVYTYTVRSALPHPPEREGRDPIWVAAFSVVC